MFVHQANMAECSLESESGPLGRASPLILPWLVFFPFFFLPPHLAFVHTPAQPCVHHFAASGGSEAAAKTVPSLWLFTLCRCHPPFVHTLEICLLPSFSFLSTQFGSPVFIISQLLEEVRQLQVQCPRCGYVPLVLAALMPHCSAFMQCMSQVCWSNCSASMHSVSQV